MHVKSYINHRPASYKLSSTAHTMLRFPFGTNSGVCVTLSVSRLQRSTKCKLFCFQFLCKLYIVQQSLHNIHLFIYLLLYFFIYLFIYCIYLLFLGASGIIL